MESHNYYGIKYHVYHWIKVNSYQDGFSAIIIEKNDQLTLTSCMSLFVYFNSLTKFAL